MWNYSSIDVSNGSGLSCSGASYMGKIESLKCHEDTEIIHNFWVCIQDVFFELWLKVTVSHIFWILAVYLFWIVFWRPYNLVRDYTDFGFEQVLKDNRGKSNAEKRHAINKYRKLRKIGDLPPAYPNGWFAILESDQLPVGAIKEVNVLGLNLVAWRGESCKCYVADAYCPHLGANLGVGGKVNAECIVCPFHSWSFDGCTGKLKNIPYSETVPEFANLKMWTTTEKYGFIYLWYHADELPPTWELDDIPEIEQKAFKYRGRSEFRVTCHIQEIPENGADVTHLSTLHTSSVINGTNPENSWLQCKYFNHVWSASWKPNKEPREHEAILNVHHHVDIFNKMSIAKVDVDVRQVGPGVVIMKLDTIFGVGFFIQNVTPLEPLLQRVVHRFYSSPFFIHPVGQLCLHTEGIQISRDIRIWNRKTFIKNPILTKEDKQIKSFRKWYSQFYSDKSYQSKIGNNATVTDSFNF